MLCRWATHREARDVAGCSGGSSPYPPAQQVCPSQRGEHSRWLSVTWQDTQLQKEAPSQLRPLEGLAPCSLGSVSGQGLVICPLEQEGRKWRGVGGRQPGECVLTQGSDTPLPPRATAWRRGVPNETRGHAGFREPSVSCPSVQDLNAGDSFSTLSLRRDCPNRPGRQGRMPQMGVYKRQTLNSQGSGGWKFGARHQQALCLARQLSGS